MIRKIATALVALLVATAASAQTKPKVTELGETPSSILYIGNSFFYFNNGMGGHVGRLNASAEAAKKLRQTEATISGSSLQWHDVESYFRPNAVGAFSFDPENNVVFNKNDKLFDVAVMMDCSQCPIHPTLKSQFVEYARKDSDIVRKHGAKPVLFMSWAYQNKPEMTQGLAEAYTQAGNDNGALVIPAGLAFARVVKEHPEINLYISDKRHPTLAGSYLAAATSYAAMFKHSPVGLAYTAGLDVPTAKMLQEAAWATVREYYGK
ncbi:MAG TPA: hypothetical protein VMI56_03015 [Reyranella sp.]|nr:hypothetical protein [Reyranella sp.]